jgi:oxysterol-binding protein-related protein 3/6/7
MQGKPSFPLTLSEYANRILPGFARRYFTLYQTGLLSYSFEPGKPSRDQLSIPHAAISTYPGRKDIHIDSHNATFHLKCLSSDDFNKWMAALRRFIAADGRRSSLGLSTPRATHLSRSAAVVDEMGTVCFSQVIIIRV